MATRENNERGAGVRVRGRISRLFFKSESFSAGVIDVEGGAQHKFAGPVVADVRDEVELVGKWHDDPKFGRQIKVESFSYARPVDTEGLVGFLANSKAFHDVGPARARALVDAAGADWEAALASPVALASRAGLSVGLVEGVAAEWFSKRDANFAMAEIARFGVTPGRAAKLYAKFGAGVAKTIADNPYWLIGRVPGFGFLTVDKYAMAAGIKKTSPARIRACVLHLMREQLQDGHTWQAMATLRTDAIVTLKLDSHSDDAQVDGRIEDLLADGELVSFSTSSGARIVWLRHVHNAESAVVKRFEVSGDAREFASEIDAAALDRVRTFEPRLNDEQVRAVACAVAFRLSVVSGGAGTGKTFIVDTIARMFAARSLRVALCAPTGKAAKRLEEVVGLMASTIHRLLEPIKTIDDDVDSEGMAFQFSRDEGNPIDADVVVVDEVSMVDTLLMHKLFRAVDWKRTKVVLVGDHNQLPPVGPGAMLRDAIMAKPPPCPVTTLERIVRQAGVLKANVSALLEGRVARSEATPPETPEGLKPLGPWYVLDKSDDEDAAKAGLVRMLDKLAEMDMDDPTSPTGSRKIDPVWDAQILTPMRKTPIGVPELNRLLQAWAQARLGRDVAANDGASRLALMLDDKVIYTRNNYLLGVMNGSTGRVLAVLAKGDQLPADISVGQLGEDEVRPDRAKAPGYVVDFDGAKTFVTGEDKNDLDLAYAITVHKSQGSEFPIAVFVCHKSHRIMLHRGLIYTAASRARKCAVIIGDRWGHRIASETVASDARRTMLSLVRSGEIVSRLAIA